MERLIARTGAQLSDQPIVKECAKCPKYRTDDQAEDRENRLSRHGERSLKPEPASEVQQVSDLTDQSVTAILV